MLTNPKQVTRQRKPVEIVWHAEMDRNANGDVPFMMVPLTAFKGLDLNATERWLLCVIMYHYRGNPANSPCISLTTLADLCYMDRSNLNRVIKRLVKKGILGISSGKRGSGIDCANRYFVSSLIEAISQQTIKRRKAGDATPKQEMEVIDSYNMESIQESYEDITNVETLTDQKSKS